VEGDGFHAANGIADSSLRATNGQRRPGVVGPIGTLLA